MILAVDVNDGEMMWTAKKVEFKKIKDEDLKAPTKGEPIREEDFRKKMEEMRQRNGGGNVRIMRN
jgi:GLPGLI family protein